jgi:hypothetical protein
MDSAVRQVGYGMECASGITTDEILGYTIIEPSDTFISYFPYLACCDRSLRVIEFLSNFTLSCPFLFCLIPLLS